MDISLQRPTAGAVKVDPAAAVEVAASFTAGRSRPGDPVVTAAYEQLQSQSDQLFKAVTDRQRGCGVRVVFTRCPDPYLDDRELIEAVRSERLLEVTMAAAEPDRRHPLLDCRPGAAYDRFRAVHDILGHAIPGFGFDRDGEYAAWLAQEQCYAGLARWALATELHGEHSVRWTTGDVADHKALLLDARLLQRSRDRARKPTDQGRGQGLPQARRSQEAATLDHITNRWQRPQPPTSTGGVASWT